ncbi:hypothetical protein TB2_034220 [Malus domestica]
MGENLRENTPPPDSDPELTLIVSKSPSSSAITLNASKELRLRCSHAALDASMEWTNEKHKLYINSLETSFVNKLYRSMRLREWNKQKNVRGTHSSHELPFKTQNSSEQFMVLQDGSLQKINLQRNETLMESTADSHVTLKSPGISNFLSAGKGCNGSSPNLREHVLSCSTGIHLREKLTSKNINASSREVSGQNFVDEDDGEKLRNESIPKRHKRAAADAFSNDQLVPLGNFDTKEVSVVHNVPFERVEQEAELQDRIEVLTAVGRCLMQSLTWRVLVGNDVWGNGTVLRAKVYMEETISVGLRQ